MRKFVLKALFSLLTLSKDEEARPNWYRIILIFSTAVTVGLLALYAYEKATGRS